MTAHHDPHHETAPMHDPPDQWHDHSADPKPQHAHASVINARAVILIGIGLFAAVLVSTVIVYQYYVWYTTRMLNERASSTQRMVYEERERAQRTALNRLKSDEYGWLDHDTVRVPVDEAMEQVIGAYRDRNDGEAR